jgi:hypothetical protein
VGAPGPARDESTFFVGATDVATRHVLQSSIESMRWAAPKSTPGRTVRVIATTRYVGDGAPAVLDVSELTGRRVLHAEGEVAGNRFQVDVAIPIDLPPSCTGLLARLTLPRHNLEASSVLGIEAPVVFHRLAWSSSTARHGATVRLMAETRTEPTPVSEVVVQVYRVGREGADEPVRGPVAAAIQGGRLDMAWTIPTEEDLGPRETGTTLCFRLIDADGVASPPSPPLQVEHISAGVRPTHHS